MFKQISKAYFVRRLRLFVTGNNLRLHLCAVMYRPLAHLLAGRSCGGDPTITDLHSYHPKVLGRVLLKFDLTSRLDASESTGR